jgi:hypothetical protein
MQMALHTGNNQGLLGLMPDAGLGLFLGIMLDMGQEELLDVPDMGGTSG